MHKMSKVWIIALIGLLVAAPVKAASIDMSKTVKAAFDKMAASADASLGSGLNSAYQELTALQSQNTQWDQTLTKIHAENSDRLSQFSKELKQLDTDKRQRLELEYKQTKEKYEPLFSSYTALNKQITFARFFKSKEATAALRAQAEAMQIPLQLARQEIKNKLDAWNTAKSSTADTVSKVKKTIAETNPLQDQIKAKKKAITALNSQFTEAWRPFSLSVKKGDATATLNALNATLAVSRHRNEQKESIYALEVGIKDILQRAKSRMN